MSEVLFRGFSPEAMEARCQGRMLERRVGIVTDFLSGLKDLGQGPVLELGAGTGQTMLLVSRSFPKVRFMAVEPVGEYVRYAKEKYACGNPLLDYRAGTADTLSLPDNSVACAYSVNIWHHIDAQSLKGSAANAARVLKAGGCYLVVEPNFRHPYVSGYQAWMRRERNFLPWRELKALQEFFVVEKTSFCFALPEFVRVPPPWLSQAEEALERCPVLAGSVAYVLRKKAARLAGEPRHFLLKGNV
jgi:ubiquinone/menaquinone biosynthesis C-methylase UbiE